MGTDKVRVRFVNQIKSTDTEHEEETILAEDFRFYPSYKAGDTIFLEIIVKNNPKENMRLQAFKILDVAHSVRQHLNKASSLSPSLTFLSLDVFMRKID